jgi:hypothetical protein
MTTDDPGSIMSAATKHDPAYLFHLVSLGAVAAAIVGVFFGIGYSLIAPPDPAAPLKDPVPEAQALQVDELHSPDGNDAAGGWISPPPAHEVATSPMLGAPSEPEPPASGSVETRAARVAPPKITRAKKIIVHQRRREATQRHWAALWRPDASAGPNPGGGFYGPPNINIGNINPR